MNSSLIFAKNILNTFTEKDIFIDVGAYPGDYMELMKKGECYAFEASPRNYTHMLKQAKFLSDSPIPIINLFNKGVYNDNLLYVVKEGNHNGLDSIEIQDSGENETVYLDQYNFENVKLIKIDAEGSDFFVLLGVEKTIDKYHPYIIVEHMWEGKNTYKKLIEDFLTEKGYIFKEFAENFHCIWNRIIVEIIRLSNE